MVRAKLTLSLLATAILFAGLGAWYLIAEKQAAQQHRAEFFGAKQLPTSGGKPMRPEW